MSEKDHSLYRYWMSARTQEPFKLAGWLVELHTWRTSSPVGDPPSWLDQVAVLVVLVRPPVIAVAAHGAVVIFNLDGNESLRPQEKMVDFAAAGEVTAQQRPTGTYPWCP